MRPGLQITKRDIALLSALLTRRVLTAEQFVALGFFSSRIRANARLRKLRAARLIREIAGLPFATTAKNYELATASVPLVSEALDLDFSETRTTVNRGISL